MVTKSGSSPEFSLYNKNLSGGNNITAGYYKMPEKTEEEYFTDKAGRRWFRSGDIGQV